MPRYIPKNTEAEEAVVGSLLISPAYIKEVSEVLEVGDFLNLDAKDVYKTLLSLYTKGEAIDIITSTAEMERLTGRKDCLSVIARLTTSTPNAFNIDTYVREVQSTSVRRQWFLALQDFAKQVFDPKQDPNLLKTEFQKTTKKISDINISRNIISASEAVDRFKAILDVKQNAVKIGIPQVDNYVGGLPLGEVVILAADSSVGKTALALQWAEVVAQGALDPNGVPTKKGDVVLYVTIESKAHIMIQRRVCGIAGIPQKLIRKANLTNIEKNTLKQVSDAYGATIKDTLFFDDVSRRVEDVRASIAMVKPKIVIIDHLGELEVEKESQTLGLLENFSTLKSYAKQYNTAMVIIHTLSADNVPGDSLSNRIPSFHSLGWAKDLRYKTDIMFVLVTEREPIAKAGIRTALWVLKDREGAKGEKLQLLFNPEKQTFADDLSVWPDPTGKQHMGQQITGQLP